MLLDETNGGGGHRGPWCPSCKQPILEGQKTLQVTFNNDPHGFNGTTGLYHAQCGRPFASLARVINLNPWAGR